MSNPVLMSPWFEPSLQLRGFAELARRLYSRSKLITAYIPARRGQQSKPSNLIEIDLTSAGFDQLLMELDDSDKCLTLNFAYELSDRSDSVSVEATFSGRNHQSGRYVNTLGQVELFVDENDITRSERQVIHDQMNAAYQCGVVNNFPAKTEPQLQVRSFNVSRDLILDVCGINHADALVRPAHAFAYLGLGILPPHQCSMVFHRNIHEFRRDLCRSYLDRYRKVVMPEMLTDKFSELSPQVLQEQYLASLGRDPKAWELPLKTDFWNVESTQFINRLKIGDVLGCLKWEDSELELLFEDLSDRHPLLEYHKYSYGQSLITHPSLTLAPVYEYVIDAYRPGGLMA